MQDLRQLQSELINHLVNKTTGIEDYIADGGPINKQARLGIYSNAYKQRLRGVIDTDHEVLSFYLGDDLFNILVEGYIDAHPSTHTSLRDFCSKLPNYLKETVPFSGHPILAELARFEQTLLFAFDANDARTIDASFLQTLPKEEWPNIKVRFHPSVQLFETSTNCVEIWQAMKKNSTPPSSINAGHVAWIIWRNPARITEFKSIEESELHVIKTFLHGSTLASACEELLSFYQESEVSGMIISYLQKWLEHKQITALHTK